jgi:choline dehydrogenase-like flavoprotein
MILESPRLAALREFAADVHVIGSGPVGTVTALALADRGFRVLVLESGGAGPEPAADDLAVAECLSTDSHFEPHTAVARRLGGTSNLWAGRCVPFDPIDFRARPWLGLDAAWPIGPDDLAPWLAPALDALAAGAAVFEARSGPTADVAADPAFRCDTLERWSNVPRIQKLHARALAERGDLLVALRTTVTGFRYRLDGGIGGLELHVGGEGRGEIPAARVVLAAGGNASTRLLLLEQEREPSRFGGVGGPLGRFYMGHLSGQIADLVFESGALHDALDYHVDPHGSYVRRRLVPSEATQERERLANVAFWPVVPPIADAAHRSGPLSAVFLALSLAPLGRRLIAEPVRLKHVGQPPYRRAAHLGNVVRDLPRTLGFAPAFLWRNRVARMRLPGFFLRNPARRYGLEYHAEQLPDPESRLTLAEARDRLGQRRLRIDLRFGAEDAASVVRAHAALEAWLLRNHLARLDYYHADPAGRAAAVLVNARDGAHQVGTIRMAREPGEGVVDGRCRVFGTPGLHVVSTAVLPTSGQANPTLTAVQLSLRLADDLAAARAGDGA